MAESLNHKLEVEGVSNSFPGIRIVRGIKSINHSQFVDDTLLLGSASLIIVTIFKSILDSFLDVSGGLVNHKKHKIFGWHTNTYVMHMISRLLQFLLVENWAYFRYLGIPIFLKGSTSHT
jgi:hypothetical protein